MGQMDQVERRIFDMLGSNMTTPQMARALGMDVEEALPLIRRVIHEYGTPNLAALRREIDVLRNLRV